jgi:hypothetical protein
MYRNMDYDWHDRIKRNYPELLRKIDTKIGLQGELKERRDEFPPLVVRAIWVKLTFSLFYQFVKKLIVITEGVCVVSLCPEIHRILGR